MTTVRIKKVLILVLFLSISIKGKLLAQQEMLGYSLQAVQTELHRLYPQKQIVKSRSPEGQTYLAVKTDPDAGVSYFFDSNAKCSSYRFVCSINKFDNWKKFFNNTYKQVKANKVWKDAIERRTIRLTRFSVDKIMSIDIEYL